MNLKPRRAHHGDLFAAALSHRGRRPSNEDRLLLDLPRGRLAVIDGMGGQRAGERAAAIAYDALDEPGSLTVALAEANRRILAAAQEDPRLVGMGCVATALQLEGRAFHLAHVGDTRAMQITADGATLLTRDHTRAAQLQAVEGLTHREATARGGGHVVLRDLGAGPQRGTAWIQRVEGWLDGGDLLLLCSDGLSDALGTAPLLRRLARARRAPLGRLVVSLVREALAAGGRDNISVIVLRRRRRWWRRWTQIV